MTTLTEKINVALDAGKTVQITTYLRVTRIKAKNRAEWRELGFEYFVTDAEGLTRMISRTVKGKPVYDIITGNKITIF